MTINIEDFQSWPEIFTEINRQANLKTFSAIEPDTTNVFHQETKPRSSSVTEAEPIKRHEQGRRASEHGTIGNRGSLAQLHVRPTRVPCFSIDAGSLQGESYSPKRSGVQPRSRHNSMPTFATDTYEFEQDTRLTDAARKLSKEEMELLYKDILKPLDFYFILRERRRESKGNEELFQ